LVKKIKIDLKQEVYIPAHCTPHGYAAEMQVLVAIIWQNCKNKLCAQRRYCVVSLRKRALLTDLFLSFIQAKTFLAFSGLPYQ
jgi:hypothetical protein